MTKTVERDDIPLKERQVNSAPLKNLLYKLFPRERNGRRNRAHVVYERVKKGFYKPILRKFPSTLSSHPWRKNELIMLILHGCIIHTFPLFQGVAEKRDNIEVQGPDPVFEFLSNIQLFR